MSSTPGADGNNYGEAQWRAAPVQAEQARQDYARFLHSYRARAYSKASSDSALASNRRSYFSFSSSTTMTSIGVFPTLIS
jgi:hypothetical protein